MILCKYSHEVRFVAHLFKHPSETHNRCLRVSAQFIKALHLAVDGRRCVQPASASVGITTEVGNQGSRKNSNSHIDASHSRQPLVKGERLVRYEVNAVMLLLGFAPRQRRSQVPEHDAVVLFCVKLPEECGQPFGC